MSLLDDVSIVVTPNGYKAGTLYGVLPTATEGSELVVNGDFASDTWWLKSSANVNISNGKGNFTAGSVEYFYKTNLLTVGKRYKLVYEITDFTTGYISAFGGNWSVIQTAVGTYEIYFTCVDTTFGLVGNAFVGSIDNVSVKEWTASDMDVTRATAGTRVDENGLVNYAEVLGSELVTNGDFDSNITGWSAKDCTIAWDNGKLKADNSSGNANGGAFQNIGLVTGKTYQMTATMQLLTGSSNGTFNLFTSAAGGTGQTSVYTGSTLVVGGAAVTETFYFTPGSGDVSIQFTCDEANATYTIDNISVKEVTRNNVPRIDYTGGGCPHILAEPQRTNLIPYSNGFSYSSYTRNGTTATTGFLSPDGTLNAYKLLEDNTNAIHRIYQTATVTGSPNTTISIYVKYLGRKYVLMRIADSNVGRWYDIENGVTGGTYLGTPNDSSIESAGNGWYRISITHTVSNQSRLELWVSDTESVSAYQGDTSKGVYLFGGQLEVGTYPTSYIPTSGSSVTRNQDQFTRDGISSLINSTEGVLFGEIAALSNTSTDRVMLSLSDGTTSNRVYIRYGNASNQIEARSTVGGANSGLTSFVVTDETDFIKVAYKWKLNDYALWINGVEVATVSSGVVNSANTLNKLSFDSGSGTRIAEGKIKQLMCFDETLSDEELSDLTGQANLSFNNLAEFYGYTIL